MITKPEEDKLTLAFDALDVDLGRLLAQFRKLKRDRNALLEACKESLRLCDGEDWLFDLREQLVAAIDQAESEE